MKVGKFFYRSKLIKTLSIYETLEYISKYFEEGRPAPHPFHLNSLKCYHIFHT